MNLKLIPLSVVTFCTFLPQQALSQETDWSRDEAAIRTVIEEKTKGFNEHDPAGQAALFTPDADFYASNGSVHVVGRQKILDGASNAVLLQIR